MVALSARLGSELVARADSERRIIAVIERLSTAVRAPVLWWLLAAAVVAFAVYSAFVQPPLATQATRFTARFTSRVSTRFITALAALVVVFAVHGGVQWHRLSTPHTGEYSGVVVARSDALLRNSAVTLVVEVEGENFRITARGRSRSRVRGVRMGDVLLVDGLRVAYDERRLRFSAGRHVQGELRNVVVHATAPPPAPWHRAANRIHELVDRGSRTMQRHDAALVRGLILGDESRQPAQMTAAFRGAGLGHLLAVSGQNVALLLAALTPLLRSLTRWSRLSSAIGFVAMFALVTRLESSVVRACVMAVVVQVGFAIGRDVAPLRALAMTVTAIVAVDPLATWSVGFVLSVAATTGLVAITPLLGQSTFAATTAAQLGVAPFVVWWFGSMPSIALITNVLAVPVASTVMIIGPPLLAVAAFAPATIANVCTLPIAAAVRWVWWVAEWGTRFAVPGWLNIVVWLAVLSGVGARIARRITSRSTRVVRTDAHPRARL